jgi:hypothetical protein
MSSIFSSVVKSVVRVVLVVRQLMIIRVHILLHKICIIGRLPKYFLVILGYINLFLTKRFIFTMLFVGTT